MLRCSDADCAKKAIFSIELCFLSRGSFIPSSFKCELRYCGRESRTEACALALQQRTAQIGCGVVAAESRGSLAGQCRHRADPNSPNSELNSSFHAMNYSVLITEIADS